MCACMQWICYLASREEYSLCISSTFNCGLSHAASGSGDPHYTTFDGRYYTFNGDGDFTLLEILPENREENTEENTEKKEPVFTLQGRLGRVSFWGVTTHLGLAFGQPNLAFHVSGYDH